MQTTTEVASSDQNRSTTASSDLTLPFNNRGDLQKHDRGNRVLVRDAELSFVQAVRRTYPAHYALFNNELYFSNMLLTDWRLRDRSFKILFYVSDLITVTIKYQVKPFIIKNMAKLYWLIRYKLLFDNFHLHTFE